MGQNVRIGSTQKKNYGPSNNFKGYGFDIEKLGTGLSAGEWLPVATLVYETEEASKIAEGLMRQAMKDIVHAERGTF